MAKPSGAASASGGSVAWASVCYRRDSFRPRIRTTLRSSLAADTSHGAWSADRNRAASIAWAHSSKPVRIAPRRDDRS
jgi:hypothetical protein